MIASLPMYHHPKTAPDWAEFWDVVQQVGHDQGVTFPGLTPPDQIPPPWTDHWTRSDLVLSMTCGLPFRTALKGLVAYVGTVDFGLGGPTGYYRSVAIVRAQTRARFATQRRTRTRLAYNSADSQSGWAASQTGLTDGPEIEMSGFLETGSHAASLTAVAHGAADIAFLDAVTWRILQQCDPLAADVTVLGHTAYTPGLPLITARDRDPRPLRRVLAAATRQFQPDHPERMGGPMSFVCLDPEAYYSVPLPTPPSRA